MAQIDASDEQGNGHRALTCTEMAMRATERLEFVVRLGVSRPSRGRRPEGRSP
jgi:hypothetical protein